MSQPFSTRSLALALAVVGLSASVALAIPVPTNGSPIFPAGTSTTLRPELLGTVVTTRTTNFSFTDTSTSTPYTFTGTLTNSVVRENTSGTLDFYLTLSLQPLSGAPPFVGVGRALITGYQGFGADVDYLSTTAGTAVWQSAFFQTPSVLSLGDFSGQTKLSPGQTSRQYFIKTTATTYALGTDNLALYQFNGASSQPFSIYVPTIPSPAAGALLAVAGLTFTHRRRRRA